MEQARAQCDKDIKALNRDQGGTAEDKLKLTTKGLVITGLVLFGALAAVQIVTR
jgi:hypothetical protein